MWLSPQQGWTPCGPARLSIRLLSCDRIKNREVTADDDAEVRIETSRGLHCRPAQGACASSTAHRRGDDFPLARRDQAQFRKTNDPSASPRAAETGRAIGAHLLP